MLNTIAQAGDPALPHGLVHVIEDDVSLAENITDRLRSFGFEAQNFKSPAAFVNRRDKRDAGCLLLSIEFPTANGLDFQELLPAVGIHMPVVLMTEHADVSWSVRGMKAGAVDFLLKPLADEQLMSSIQLALRKDRERSADHARRTSATELVAKLTPRERQVMELVVRGLMNKQIAGALGLSEITVKLHRGSMMRKMGVRTVPDLVRAVELADKD
ncbi:LuxR C-terminal-related transcriptional regulator [Tardiphaga sp. P9-11]|uniref:response regulator transcription factor n=1 Tax=Tardiphaga sp. P9-11 TaxID=2024614 RepID=UPI0011F2FFB0|nr:LuxR C-terminal-related transcriptional regulator [Tardiphaga sp. P9-11]KAA0073957.1 DNA-binding response regulator [Tardiphaga sp. P9-11]